MKQEFPCSEIQSHNGFEGNSQTFETYLQRNMDLSKSCHVLTFVNLSRSFVGLHETVQELSNVKFVFIGKTDDTFMNQLNFKNTEFLGLVDNYHQILRSCSVLFSPYPIYAKYLGSKNKFLEAAACEMPIITTSSGAIDFRSDLLLVGDTSTELIELIKTMNNENERKNLGRNLRAEIEKNYNADIEVKKIIKLYKEYS